MHADISPADPSSLTLEKELREDAPNESGLTGEKPLKWISPWAGKIIKFIIIKNCAKNKYVNLSVCVNITLSKMDTKEYAIIDKNIYCVYFDFNK